MAKPVDKVKIEKILNCLKKHPEGTYISQIARETKLPKSTVSFLISNHLRSKVKEIIVGKRGLFKIIRLR